MRSCRLVRSFGLICGTRSKQDEKPKTKPGKRFINKTCHSGTQSFDIGSVSNKMPRIQMKRDVATILTKAAAEVLALDESKDVKGPIEKVKDKVSKKIDAVLQG